MAGSVQSIGCKRQSTSTGATNTRQIIGSFATYWMCQLLPTAKIIVFRQVANILDGLSWLVLPRKKISRKWIREQKKHHMFFCRVLSVSSLKKKKSNFWISVTSSVPVRCVATAFHQTFSPLEKLGLKTGRKLWRRGGFHGWIVDLLWVLHGLCGTGMASLGERGWGGGVFRTGGGLAEVAPTHLGGTFYPP